MSAPSDDAISLAERIFQLLDLGRFTATYKFAVLTGLLDLCVENVSRTGAAPEVLTTRQLSEKVLEVYWPQTRPWSTGRELRQSSGPGGGQAEIIRAITAFRGELRADHSLPLARVRVMNAERFESLVSFVEWKLIEMPLPRLQIVGDDKVPFLYTIGWDTGVDRAEVRRYQKTGGGDFDNRIHLRPGVGETLVRLNSLLRPLLQRGWALKVAELNDREDTELERFLFGAERVSLTTVCDPLRQLQHDRCFYCAERFEHGTPLSAEVDHFIPWSRHPDDGLDNLVVAHRRCNGLKRDFLAAAVHLERWRERSTAHGAELDQVAAGIRWERRLERTSGVARAIYLHLPSATRLWVSGQDFIELDLDTVRAALA